MTVGLAMLIGLVVGVLGVDVYDAHATGTGVFWGTARRSDINLAVFTVTMPLKGVCVC
jgi:hypothetical protein